MYRAGLFIVMLALSWGGRGSSDACRILSERLSIPSTSQWSRRMNTRLPCFFSEGNTSSAAPSRSEQSKNKWTSQCQCTAKGKHIPESRWMNIYMYYANVAMSCKWEKWDYKYKDNCLNLFVHIQVIILSKLIFSGISCAAAVLW